MNQILSRQDIVHNQAETFGYDCLNRLTSVGSRQITYASNGNVTAIDGAGLYIFTGKPKEKYEYPDFKEDSKPYRLGTLYLGYHNYRIGYNSEKNVRGPIQNGFHDLFHYPHFAVLSIPDKLYYGLYTSTPFTVW